MMNPLTFSTALLLTVAPLMWAGNALVGRLINPLVPPMTLNLLRWVLAFIFLLPLAWTVLRPSSGLWQHWRRFTLLSLFSVGAYNSLQYLALQTTSPINVTLVASSLPVWMMGIGWFHHGVKVTRTQLLGAAFSIAGVLLVLSRGQWEVLQQVQLVSGDIYILLATLAWAYYSWMLAKPKEPPHIRSNWSAFLLGQIVFGLVWSALFCAGEWTLTDAHIIWSWPVAAALVFIALGPAILAYRAWGAGIARSSPTMAGFFSNLTPLFAALLSSVFLGEPPQLYHALAFVLIVSGIVVSARRA
ncbi:MAG: DMT family transporter [Burkholderiaceae bacterium]